MSQLVSTNKVCPKISFWRETLYTYQYVWHIKLWKGYSDHRAPKLSDALVYALNHVNQQNINIDWYKLSIMEKSQFGIPQFLSEYRFQTSISLNPNDDQKLTNFTNNIAPYFTEKGKRAPYRAKAVALLFRAIIAEDYNILPIK